MDGSVDEQGWLQELAPAQLWEEEAAKRALDELFSYAAKYRSSKSFKELLAFAARFRFYAPYNAMLVHIQMPGARYVAPAHRWAERYGRSVKADARPLVILQPMGPVMFVFDVADTDPGPNATPLPPEMEKPFEVRRGQADGKLDRTMENGKRDGIRTIMVREGSQSAGLIRAAKGAPHLRYQVALDDQGQPQYVTVPTRYDLLVNERMSPEAKYATVVHELAHLYCGHLGTPNERWWPDRRGLSLEGSEFEAESVAYLVCTRTGIDSPSDQYLAGYFEKNQHVPQISLECVMKSAGLIEKMGHERLKARKSTEQ